MSRRPLALALRRFTGWRVASPFLAANPVFGVLDAIGHAPIIVVLVVLGLTRTRLPAAMQGAADLADALRRGATCTPAGLASVGLYWGLQALAYRQLDAIEPGLKAVAVLLALPLLMWCLPRLSRWMAVAWASGPIVCLASADIYVLGPPGHVTLTSEECAVPNRNGHG